jgi:hypothetical protein
MTDLRNRITAALESADRTGYGTRPYGELADAVIAELGLRKDAVGLIHRYVTEWQSDEPRKLWDIFADADRASGE